MPAVTKNLRDGQITISDGDTPANSVAIAVDDGNLKFIIQQRPAIAVQDRGEHSHLRQGSAQVLDGSFSVKFKEFLSQGANGVSPYEALLMVGAAAAWETTNADGGDVETLDLIFDIVSPTSGEQDERVTIADIFDRKVEFSEGDDANVLACSFKYYDSNITIAKVAAATTTAAATTEAETTEAATTTPGA